MTSYYFRCSLGSVQPVEILEMYHNHHRSSLQELYESAHIRWRSIGVPVLNSYIYSLRKTV